MTAAIQTGGQREVALAAERNPGRSSLPLSRDYSRKHSLVFALDASMKDESREHDRRGELIGRSTL